MALVGQFDAYGAPLVVPGAFAAAATPYGLAPAAMALPHPASMMAPLAYPGALAAPMMAPAAAIAPYMPGPALVPAPLTAAPPPMLGYPYSGITAPMLPYY